MQRLALRSGLTVKQTQDWFRNVRRHKPQWFLNLNLNQNLRKRILKVNQTQNKNQIST